MAHTERPSWLKPEITVLRSASDASVGPIEAPDEYNTEMVDKGPSGPV